MRSTETIDLGFTTIPITVMKGAKPGPTLALTAGVHGYEYPPILALQRLDVKLRAGTLILVHVANMPSFLGRTVYFSPLDGKNLNRVFPGREDGTPSERIAHAITTQVIDKCDYLLDLHCGDANEALRPYVYQTVTDQAALDGKIAELVAHLGFDHIVIDKNRPKDAATSMYCSNTAITRGKPAVTVESGYLGSTDEKSVRAILSGVENVLRHLNMIDGKPRRVAKPVYLDPADVLNSPATGILYPRVERNAMVKKGQVLANITDFFGKKLATVKAPFAGVVLYVVATPPITVGQPVACVGRIRR
ncbi:MAG TPA: succinylglutamate desuccinylase/aspartoacylase family protein [Bryobacteraceae bacterium]|nr:succinylglutamate desuccinylase/aspartoacylase family protein [Bryobacteraceae bacterium]